MTRVSSAFTAIRPSSNCSPKLACRRSTERKEKKLVRRSSTAERQAAVEFAKAAAMRPRIVGEALNKVAADPKVEVAMFEILEIQKIVESKARITMIPEKGGILAELLASTSRSPESPPSLRPLGPATAQT